MKLQQSIQELEEALVTALDKANNLYKLSKESQLKNHTIPKIISLIESKQDGSVAVLREILKGKE